MDNFDPCVIYTDLGESGRWFYGIFSKDKIDEELKALRELNSDIHRYCCSIEDIETLGIQNVPEKYIKS